jgi:hypothetical protein
MMDMVKRDNTAQWLAGDDLKKDQFRFIYQTMLIMYRSALKQQLLAEDKRVLEVVLPNLVAFRAIKHGKEILIKKKNDVRKEQEKMERMMKTGTMGILGGSSTTTMGSTSEVVEKKPTSKNTSPVRGASPTKVAGTDKKDAALTL